MIEFAKWGIALPNYLFAFRIEIANLTGLECLPIQSLLMGNGGSSTFPGFRLIQIIHRNSYYILTREIL